MNLLKSLILFFTSVFFIAEGLSQETLPIYSDYLSDNVYLVHPSAAGIGNTGKLRLLQDNNGVILKVHQPCKL